MSLKAFDLPSIKISGQLVSPDEIDRYEVFQFRPQIDAGFLAHGGTSGTADTVALGIRNRLPDTPRNLNFSFPGSATGQAGTVTVNGVDQFGITVTESLGFGSADNGGTVVGSMIFAQITSGTMYYGTSAGVGTPVVGFVPGTGCLIGLPIKLNGTTDVVHLGMQAGTGAITYGGGTIAAFVNVPRSAIRPAATLNGTSAIIAWVKPRYAGELYPNGTMRNLSQAV